MKMMITVEILEMYRKQEEEGFKKEYKMIIKNILL